MLQKQVNLYHLSLKELSSHLKHHFPNHYYNYSKHQIIIENELKETIGNIRLPLHWTINEKLKITDEKSAVLYLSIKSGNAAICVMEGMKNVYHSTFSAYMTRKKQGFSQIKYLNKKGKSRAGSRVRLSSSIGFFESINTSLNSLMEKYEFARIAVDISKSLIPFLYQSKTICPFPKTDSRIYKIPLHIPQANYNNLNSAIKKLMAPTLFYDSKYEEILNPPLWLR